MTTAIVWFRQDLRLHDNPALWHAVAEHDNIIAVYLWSPEELAPWAPGDASRWWLHHSLANLIKNLKAFDCPLIIRRTNNTAQTLTELCNETSANEVYAQRCLAPMQIQQEITATNTLKKYNVTLHTFDSQTLAPPQASTKKSDNTPYRVFTPFWRNLRSTLNLHAPLAVPSKINSTHKIKSLKLHELKLIHSETPEQTRHHHWQAGEAHALEAMENFCSQHIEHYQKERDIPATQGTSRLSAHLHFGEISPRQIAWRLHNDKNEGNISTDAYEVFLRQLAWRDFAYCILFYFPHTTTEAFNPKFTHFPWAPNQEWLNRWQQGMTGFPIIDAGMRELLQTGWMHNRVRMICASFLTKHCNISWREGAQWFWGKLVDADLANNSMGWQWCAGSGVDAAPYFRIFNPLRQGEKFDPQGLYIKQWLPELSQTPAKLLHNPYSAELRAFNYPTPMFDLKERREHALSLLK